MEVDIHWEIVSEFNSREIRKLDQVLHELPQTVNFFDKLHTLPMPEPSFLNIIIVNDSRIRKLNNTYRNVNKATDVLTFPFDIDMPDAGGNTAEIYISQETALRQSQEQNLPLLHEFIILVVHGFLHAFHYDHEKSDAASKEMSNLEKIILDYLGYKDLDPLTN